MTVELVRDFHVYELLPVSSEPKNQATRDANITMSHNITAVTTVANATITKMSAYCPFQ